MHIQKCIWRHSRAKPKCTCQLRPPTKSFANTVSPPDAWQGKLQSNRIELIGWNLVFSNHWDFNQCFSAVISFKDGGIGWWLPGWINLAAQVGPSGLHILCSDPARWQRWQGGDGEILKTWEIVFFQCLLVENSALRRPVVMWATALMF